MALGTLGTAWLALVQGSWIARIFPSLTPARPDLRFFQ
jgi:hypothetical protein